MKILITYATYSGGTQTASQIISDRFTKQGDAPDYKMISEISPDQIAGYDLIVFCTPTWDFNGKEGQPHEDYIKMIDRAEKISFAGKKFAVMGLGDSSYTHFCGSVPVLEKFISSAGGTLIVPSLKIDGFFYNQEAHSAEIGKWADAVIAAASV